VSGQSDVVADSSADTLTIAAGTGITITTNATTDTVTIANSATITNTAGSSGVTYKAMGVLYHDLPATGNVGAGEDTLYSQTVAANVLTTDGDALHFTLGGTYTANSNTKRIKFKFGATTFLDTGARSISTATAWTCSGVIMRASATTQKITATFLVDQAATNDAACVSAGETLSSTSAFVVTGEATSSDDIRIESATIMYAPTSSN
jgi:hypothetical protein